MTVDEILSKLRSLICDCLCHLPSGNDYCIYTDFDSRPGRRLVQMSSLWLMLLNLGNFCPVLAV
jgi:hypothetical protein